MGSVRCMMLLDEGPNGVARPDAFGRQGDGVPVAWIDVGAARDLSLYGPPSVMRQLAAIAIEAAEAAEELAAAKPVSVPVRFDGPAAA